MKKLLAVLVMGVLLCVSVPVYANPVSLEEKEVRLQVLQEQMNYLYKNIIGLMHESDIHPDDPTFKLRVIFAKVAYDKLAPELTKLTVELFGTDFITSK